MAVVSAQRVRHTRRSRRRVGELLVILVLVVGLAMNAIALPLAARRVLVPLPADHQRPARPRPRRGRHRRGSARPIKRQVVEVFGQKKLLKWSVPGAAHFFVFWAFLILATVYLEAYGSLFKILFTGGEGPMDWAIPVVGHWPIARLRPGLHRGDGALRHRRPSSCIRLQNAPKKLGRKSRFFGSHLGGAWLTLFMIFNVIWTMFLFRGASAAAGQPALRQRRLRLDRRRQPARRPQPRARSRCSRASACCCTSA